MKISLFKAILLGVFGVAALIGVFVFATYTNKNTSEEAVGTVVIWGTLPADGIQATLTTAGQTNQAFKSVSYVQKDSAALVSSLATAIATGNAPDLVLASQEELHALARFLTPIPYATLSARTFTNAFIGEASLFTAPSGAGYYGVPFLVDPLVLFSNRAILSSSGIAKPPATWEALVGLVPTVAQLTPSRQVSRGLIALGTYDNVHNARAILSSLFLQTGIALSSYSPAGNLVANLTKSPSGGSMPGQAVLGFYTQFADPSKVSYTWNASLADSRQVFLNGDLALYLGFVSEARFLKAANPNLDFDVAPLPQPATSRLKSAYGLAYAFMVPRGAKNSAGGFQVAVLLTDPTAQALAASKTGLAPASLTELTAVPADPTAAVAYVEALYTKGWLSPTPAATDSVFSGMIGNVISGRSALDTVLASAESTLTSLLQQ
jgi:ABC-type glycerol-3-phosphate transport system substrate-binding protein